LIEEFDNFVFIEEIMLLRFIFLYL